MIEHCEDCEKKVPRVVDDSRDTTKHEPSDILKANTCAFLVCEDCEDTRGEECDHIDVCSVEYRECKPEDS
jgi:hypothetical protein